MLTVFFEFGGRREVDPHVFGSGWLDSKRLRQQPSASRLEIAQTYVKWYILCVCRKIEGTQPCVSQEIRTNVEAM